MTWGACIVCVDPMHRCHLSMLQAPIHYISDEIFSTMLAMTTPLEFLNQPLLAIYQLVGHHN
jgi:hypothetical protein